MKPTVFWVVSHKTLRSRRWDPVHLGSLKQCKRYVSDMHRMLAGGRRALDWSITRHELPAEPRGRK